MTSKKLINFTSALVRQGEKLISIVWVSYNAADNAGSFQFSKIWRLARSGKNDYA